MSTANFSQGGVPVGYIVGFNRDRDSYQVPLALAEHGQLDGFVTDYYRGALPIRLRSLDHRYREGIGPEHVTLAKKALLVQVVHGLRQKIGQRPSFPAASVDSSISRTISQLATKHRDSDLLLYSGYAAQAFNDHPSRRKTLFQYHPSPELIRAAMIEDELADAAEWQPEPETLRGRKDDIFDEETQLADRALCASSFTQRGLIAAGLKPSSVAVIPYGCPTPAAPSMSRKNGGPTKFLFVGQGVQRKGLHLLLEAWRRAAITTATLTVVASRMDPAIGAFAARTPNLRLLPAVPQRQLDSLMDDADVLVLPSLVEGFGLVLGEGLARGCRLIASTNTGIVDMNLPSSIATTVPAGQVEPLMEALVKASSQDEEKMELDRAARSEAARLSWRSFREGIISAVASS